jgi:hypothetical protein
MAAKRHASANADIEEALRLTGAGGFDAACQLIETTGDPAAVAAAYNDFARALYRRNKDVQRMIDVGRRGISYALDHAARLATDSSAAGAGLREIAKTIAFNIGANTWPGWGDDGVHISCDQRKAGLAAAMLSLRLVNELNLGPQRMGTSHWLVGAHQIAARQSEAAIEAFDAAAQAFAAAGDHAAETMVRGYRALAGKLRRENAAAAQAELDRVLQDLAQQGSDAAKFFRSQIARADHILCEGPENR